VGMMIVRSFVRACRGRRETAYRFYEFSRLYRSVGCVRRFRDHGRHKRAAL
jgi:hypothetical protein